MRYYVCLKGCALFDILAVLFQITVRFFQVHYNSVQITPQVCGLFGRETEESGLYGIVKLFFTVSSIRFPFFVR